MIHGELQKLGFVVSETSVVRYPDPFRSIHDVWVFCQHLFHWHNHEHHSFQLNRMTPATIHYGQAQQLIPQRQTILDAAYLAHPERFVKPPSQYLSLPATVWINPPKLSICVSPCC